MLKLLPFDELFPADAPERLIALNAIIPKVVRALKINSRLFQPMKNNSLGFELTPKHVAMYAILEAMVEGKRSVASVSLASLYH
jgi:hypothetical protein